MDRHSRLRGSSAALLAALAVGCASPLDLRPVPHIGGYHQRVFRRCLEFEIELPATEVPPIILGCEVIDCCEGCPGPGPYEWVIDVEGPLVREVLLRFENLEPAQRERLALEGSAEWLSSDVLRVGRGRAVVSGFRVNGGPLTAAYPEVALDEKQVAAAQRDDSIDRDVDVFVGQRLSGVFVNHYVTTFQFRLCPPSESPSDKIELASNAGADSAVVLYDAKDTACFDDRTRRASSATSVGNLVPQGSCRSEVCVFSNGDAVHLFENVSAWTSSPGDVFTADLAQDPWQVPVSVWVATAPAQQAATLVQAPTEIALCDVLYDTNHAGITFAGGTTYTTVTNQNTINAITNAAMNVWNTGFCTGLANITGSGAFTPGQLNVYYVSGAFTGWYCPGSNIIAIGTNAQPETLAHELGHAFSLGHTQNVDYDGDGASDFGSDNIMWGGGSNRTHFSEGQCFRMSIGSGSALNTNGVRTGPTRACTDATINSGCPWVGWDEAPN